MAATRIPWQVQAPLLKETGITRFAQLVLLLSVFTVSVGYGVLLPVLPILVQKLASAADATAAARHTGLLTGLYTLAMFLFAPMWGWLSDRYGRRPILLIGLIGFATSTLIFAFLSDIALLYAERFLSGLFAAAVTPVAAAMIGDRAPDNEWRARRLAWLSMAGIAGFFVGPMLGGLATSLATEESGLIAVGSTLFSAPFIFTSILSVLAAAALYAVTTSQEPRAPGDSVDDNTRAGKGQAIALILALAFVTAAGVGVFEVGLALRAIQTLQMDASRLALMFAECSIVMFAAQAIVFSPFVKPETTRWLIAPAFAVMAAGVAFVGGASDFTVLLVAVGAVAVGGGILSPVLTYWLSLAAGRAQGAQLGKQTAVASLGQAIGSGAGGFLFGISSIPNASFTLMAALLGFGAIVSLAGARLLARLMTPSTTAPTIQSSQTRTERKTP
ncbi:MAG: MFS transporter [Rhodospirillaceae bacterium]|nr:MFS transporter [Rhodospirillaceae bacterium]